MGGLDLGEAAGLGQGRAHQLPSDRARREYRATHKHELPGHALIPGLVNTHTHAAMTLFRGLADDLPLMNWLREHIWPAEGRWVGEEFVAAGSALAVAEMLRGGTTSFNDMYFFPQITGRIAAAAGMRAVIGLIVSDFPSTWPADTDGYFSRAIETFDEFKGHPLGHRLRAARTLLGRRRTARARAQARGRARAARPKSSRKPNNVNSFSPPAIGAESARRTSP